MCFHASAFYVYIFLEYIPVGGSAAVDFVELGVIGSSQHEAEQYQRSSPGSHFPQGSGPLGEARHHSRGKRDESQAQEKEHAPLQDQPHRAGHSRHIRE